MRSGLIPGAGQPTKANKLLGARRRVRGDIPEFPQPLELRPGVGGLRERIGTCILSVLRAHLMQPPAKCREPSARQTLRGWRCCLTGVAARQGGGHVAKRSDPSQLRPLVGSFRLRIGNLVPLTLLLHRAVPPSSNKRAGKCQRTQYRIVVYESKAPLSSDFPARQQTGGRRLSDRGRSGLIASHWRDRPADDKDQRSAPGRRRKTRRRGSPARHEGKGDPGPNRRNRRTPGCGSPENPLPSRQPQGWTEFRRETSCVGISAAALV